MDGSLSLLQNWYAKQCDGHWEHSYGVSIETLDNPGWAIEADLHGTDAEQRVLERMTLERAEDDWLQYWVEGKKFHAVMGAQNLSEGLEAFLHWVQETK